MTGHLSELDKMASKSKKKADKGNPDCSILVGTFSNERPVVTIIIIPQVTTVRFIKVAVTRQLELDEGSHNLFGLFLGDRLSSSMKILQEDDKFTVSMLQSGRRRYFFQRIVYNMDIEERILCNTFIPLIHLMYNEFKDAYSKNLIYPPLSEEQSVLLTGLMKRAEEDEKFIVEIFNFVYRELECYYWQHYHRVEKCTLSSIVTAAEPRAREGSVVSVSINFHCLIITYFVLEEGKTVNFTFKWDKVRSVDLNRAKQCTIFEVLVESVPEEKYNNILRAISIKSNRYEYIYSMAKYFLIIHEKMANYELELYEEQQALENKRATERKYIVERIKEDERINLCDRLMLLHDQVEVIKRAKETAKEAAVLSQAISILSHARSPEQKIAKSDQLDTDEDTASAEESISEDAILSQAMAIILSYDRKNPKPEKNTVAAAQVDTDDTEKKSKKPKKEMEACKESSVLSEKKSKKPEKDMEAHTVERIPPVGPPVSEWIPSHDERIPPLGGRISPLRADIDEETVVNREASKESSVVRKRKKRIRKPKKKTVVAAECPLPPSQIKMDEETDKKYAHRAIRFHGPDPQATELSATVGQVQAGELPQTNVAEWPLPPHQIEMDDETAKIFAHFAIRFYGLDKLDSPPQASELMSATVGGQVQARESPQTTVAEQDLSKKHMAVDEEAIVSRRKPETTQESTSMQEIEGATAKLTLSVDEYKDISTEPASHLLQHPIRYDAPTYWENMSAWEMEFYKQYFEDEKKANDDITKYDKNLKRR